MVPPVLLDYKILSVRESEELPSGITVRIDSIQDSRCPAKVQCIWAGQVEVKVLLSQFRNSESVSLALQPGQQLNTATVTLGAGTYKVTLQSVLPYPGSGSNQVPTATVQVTSM